MLVLVLIAAAADPAQGAAVPLAGACESREPAEIVVCGRSRDPYRIDPSVLQAMRAREAVPDKPELGAGAALALPACVGPTACQGDFVPLVQVGLVGLEAAALAAKGEDWRQAFRTRQEEFELYKQAEQRRARERRVKVSFGPGK